METLSGDPELLGRSCLSPSLGSDDSLELFREFLSELGMESCVHGS
jgi:hypothetical protein